MTIAWLYFYFVSHGPKIKMERLFFIAIIMLVSAPQILIYRNRISIPSEHGYQGNCGKGVVLNRANMSGILQAFIKEVE